MSAASYRLPAGLVYWLDGDRWAPVSWEDWHRWKWDDVPMPGVSGGDQRFAVCVIEDDGSIVNIIPHRYALDDDGRRQRGNNGPLTAEEVAFENYMMGKREPTRAEDERRKEIWDRIWKWSMPPTAAARSLLLVLPGPVSIDPKHSVSNFLAACGLAAASGRLQ